eukprot:TRINITY_DN4513_c0_g1_i3.p1 TRINITY_DN4513_c0_g1~~TRINITY_DN4513_c0_g1_i3.p1  ORF type:complete len:540 (+),score=76.29 TRINITY_DN4513_c0_g1_i3:10-1629(+)
MKRVLLLFLLFCLFRSESDFWPWREHLHWSTDVIREECRIDPIPSVVDHNENINCTSELERIWNPSTEQFLRFATSIKDFHETAQQLQDSLRKLQILFKAPLDETNTWASVLHVLNNDTVDYEIVFSYCASSWEASSNLTNFRSLLQKTCSFISTVRSQIDVGSSPFEERVRVLVIGGGPLGLASSIESHLKGSRTTVVEKRTDYTRNTWFDVHGPPWSMALDKLKLWGIQFQDMEHVRHQEADNMIGMRNQMLERFLSKVASMIGIEMRYGWELGTICSDDSKNFAILHPRSNSTFNLNACQTHTNDSLQVEFDVILGAEGSSSKVREFFNITFLPQTRFALPNKRVVQVENLHQPSLIVNFSPVDGECPRLKKVSSGYFLDPHFPGFSIEGVTSVWKRFYSTYCSMQILMTREIGDKIVSNYRTWRNVSEEDNRWQDKAFPWEKIRQVADMLIERPITTIHSLKKMIPKKIQQELGHRRCQCRHLQIQQERTSVGASWEPPFDSFSGGGCLCHRALQTWSRNQQWFPGIERTWRNDL